jgi:thiopurine S-methyltransferase
MDTQFWLSKWTRNEIGFHSLQTSAYLMRHWASLALPNGSKVLVPLCGKSLDMVWLAAQGFTVIGVELSKLAIESFFAEQGLVPVKEQQGALWLYSAGPYHLLQGDFFDVSEAHIQNCIAFYDRAALIALPESMRSAYAKHLSALLPSGRGLLVTLKYEQDRRAGPPFSVSEQEVQALYGETWNRECLERSDVLAENSKFAAQGITWLEESVYRLER